METQQSPPLIPLLRYHRGKCLGPASTQDLTRCEPYQHHNLNANNTLGVLLIHGFCSSPHSMYGIATALQDQVKAISVPLLSGHGKDACNMRTTCWTDWVNDIETAYTALQAQCQQVVVIGQSLGGALAIQLAAQHPEIAHLILLVPAVYATKLLNHHKSIGKLLHLIGIHHLRNCAGDINKADGYEVSIAKIPLEIFGQTHACINNARQACPKLSIPTTIIASKQDHVLAPRGMSRAYQLLTVEQKELIWLDNSYHCVSLDNELDTLVEKSLAIINHLINAHDSNKAP